MGRRRVKRAGHRVPRKRGLVLNLELFEDRCLLSTITVTSTADTGAGTLRAAITSADGAAGSTIDFNIPTTDPGYSPVTKTWTITPLSPLPAITATTTIDATGQSGYAAGAPVVVILGTSTTGDGLVLGTGSSGSVVEGLAIAGFISGAGVHVESSGDVVESSQIGVDIVGGTAKPGNAEGVLVDGGANNTIGGTTAAASNLIGFNTTAGVQITGTTAAGNMVVGDLIGTGASGANLGNQVGVQIFNSSNNTIGGTATGAANTIGFNKAQGVAVLSGNQNAIQENTYQGTNGTLTPVEANDITLGPGANNYQAAPSLIAASLQMGTLSVLVAGLTAGTPVTLDFYEIDSSTSPIKRAFLQSVTLTPAATAATVSIPGSGLATGDVVGATATVAANGTSVFSNETTVQPPLTVTTTADNGSKSAPTPGSLRAAIQAANAAPGSTISFLIPTSDPGYNASTNTWTITVPSVLPTITRATIVNGESQPGYAGSPLIVVNGGGGSFDGLVLGTGSAGATSAGSVIKGLDIVDFGGSAIHVESSNDLVISDILGADPTGTVAGPGNGLGVLVDGVSGATIGGTAAGAANVIAYNTGDGVKVSGSTATGALISQNAIFANRGLGIDLTGGANGGQTAPTALAATAVGDSLIVDGSFVGPRGINTLEFFASSASGQGPAFQFLESVPITLTAAGANPFSQTLTLAAPLLPGQTITATVTSPANNTSEFAASATLQSPFVVTRTSDNVPGQAVGSLRQAILDAGMVSSGTTTISFAIPTTDPGYSSSSGVWTIAPATALPAITTPVVLNGTTQPGYSGAPVIKIAGGGSVGTGLTLTSTAAGGVIAGLDIVGFTVAGIDIATSGETVESDYLGVAPDGSTSGPGNGAGVFINGSNNTIGGAAAAAANTIAFNTAAGVDVDSGVGNLISLNAIFANGQAIVLNAANSANDNQPPPLLLGAIAFGTQTLVYGFALGAPNTPYELQFFRSAPGDPGAAGQAHVFLGADLLTTGATGSAFFFSFLQTTTGIGQTVTATEIAPTNDTSALSNGVSAGTSFVVTTTADNGSNSAPTTGSLRAAIINADAVGGSRVTFDIPTSDPGYSVATNSWTIAPPTPLPAVTAATTIDGTTQPGFSTSTFAPVIQIDGGGQTGDGLTLAAGSDGSVIKGLDISNFAGAGISAGSGNNAIQGDYLGTNIAGTAAGPGNETGVSVSGSGNTIGGTTAGAADVIAYNTAAGGTGAGVVVTTGTGNLIRQNAIFANDQQIVLASGGNNQQSAPVITGVNSTAATGTTIIQGTVAGFTSSSVYRLDFFSSAAGDPAGTQAHVFLGTGLVTTNAAGSGSFTITLPVVVALGQTVTATATSATNNTSALASAVSVSSPYTVTRTADSGVGSLRQAILNADAVTGSTPLTISFAIAGTAPYAILLQSSLPVITRPVVLNAESETGYAGTPLVQLSGLGLGGDGIVLGPGSGGSTVEGFAISGFQSGAGIHVESPGDLIMGTWLGVDATGLAAGPGNAVGVFIDGAGSNTIGGSTAAAANLIGFNTAAGVSISGSSATGNLVIGDLIGADAAGDDLGNQIGLVIAGSSANNTIGGSTAGAANVIAFSTGDGVQVSGPLTTGNLISRNSIHANGGLAIDLLNGGNGQANQAFSLTNVTIIASLNETVVQGSLVSFPAGTYTLEFFASAPTDPPGNGQATTYLTTATLNSDPSSPNFTLVLPVLATVGSRYSATATSAANDTSELSTSTAGTTSFVVSSTADSGPGTLRQAIQSIVQFPAAGAITFDLQGTAPFVIGIASPLPTITVPVRIDGTTEPGFAGVPLVQLAYTPVLNSAGPGVPVDGMVLAPGSDGSVVTGLGVVGFTGVGIHVQSSNVLITGNLLGENSTGTAPGPGDAVGVLVDGMNGAAAGVTIGGTAAGAANSIGGNTTAGVWITGAGASGDLVLGNLIGADPASPANTSLNNGIGIAVAGAPATTIGGTVAGSANLIGDNTTAGISISGTVAGSVAGAGTTVEGNFIGTDAAANNLGNGEGIILDGSNANLIGGPEVTVGDPVLISGPGNVIAFSTIAGIEITGPAAVNNAVQGNYIGTDSFDDLLGNPIGVLIDQGASNNLIGGLNATISGTISSTSTAGNIIGANTIAGVEILDPGTTANTVEGNVIGVDLANPKLSVLGNVIGVLVEGASGNVIGGIGSTSSAMAASAANVIGYNTTAGVELAATAQVSETTGVLGGPVVTSNNLVEGNFIGVDQAGDKVGNGGGINGSGAGVLLLATAQPGNSQATQAIVSGNTIGGVATAAGSNPAANVIGANPRGIEISATLGSVVAGTATGSAQATGNLIEGNDVGLNPSGANLANRVGILIAASDSVVQVVGQGSPPDPPLGGLATATNNTIGGTAEANGVNLSGNNVGFNTKAGIEITAQLSNQSSGSTIANTVSASNNVVQGNLIGTTADTTGNQGNGDGVLLTAAGSAAGSLTLAGNLVGGPLTTTVVNGTAQNALGPAANFIGANSTDGVVVDMTGLVPPAGPFGPGAAFNNTIEGNLVSRNTLNGIHVKGDLTGANFLGQIDDNFVGVTADGSSAYNLTQNPPKPQGNGLSGILLEETSGTSQGTASAVNVFGNLVSGNGLSGVTVETDNSITNPYADVAVSGNIIGLDVTGETAVATGNLPLGNVLDGVLVNNVLGVTIGGTAAAATVAGAGNVISGNLGRGVEVRGYALAPPTSSSSPGDSIMGNIVGADLTGTQNSSGASYLGNLSDGVYLLVPPNVQITGNIIGDNRGAGIHAATQTSSTSTAYTANGLITIQGNFIGTNSQGSNLFNGSDGVFIDTLVPAAESMGTVARIVNNLIAGNHSNGVDLLNSAKIAVAGNTLGGALANASNGVFLNFSSEITIGGATTAAQNIISGNQSSGVLLSGNLKTSFPGQTTPGNVVVGNAIGVDSTRSIATPNDNSGVVISFSSDNTIGGTTASLANVISGNRLYGVLIAGNAAQGAAPGNVLLGNLIGVAGDGESPLANTADGVFLLNVAGEQIGGALPGQGNVISGNSGDGVRIFGGGSTGDQVLGNMIGVGSTGEAVVPNQGDGVLLDDAGPGNTIGGAQAGSGNVISGNAQSGVMLISDSNSIGFGALVERNKIGVDGLGTSARPNNANGVFIFGSAANTIGGASDALGNIISGNLQAGVSIYTPAATAQAIHNIVEGNLIGVDASGSNPVGNPAGGVVIVNSSTNTVGPANVISGNQTGGVIIEAVSAGAVATGNLVAGDLIGVALGGGMAIPGQLNGVILTNAVGDFIGGAQTVGGLLGANVPNMPANVISGNQQFGVLLDGSSSGDTLAGSFIGTDGSGTAPIPNGQGVFIQDLSTAPSNDTIGGTAAGSGNLISGNTSDGIIIQGPAASPRPGIGSLVIGNVIGLSSSDAPLSNSIGVVIQDSPSNTIGGTAYQSQNVISGNASAGIDITGQSAAGNIIQGDYIGTNFAGSGFPSGTNEADPAQLIGVFLNGSIGDTVGGTIPGSNNVISANNLGIDITGIKASNSNQITGSQNVVEGNLVGVSKTGLSPVPNLEAGVFIDNSQANIIGPGNVLSANGIAGVEIINQGSIQNVVAGNVIGANVAGAPVFTKGTSQPTLVSAGIEPGIGIYADAQLNGVVILGASNNVVGQTTTVGTSPNLIAGNVQVGVYISNRDFQNSVYPTPVGNLISGNAIVSDGLYGVLLYNSPNNPAPPYGGQSPALKVNFFHGSRTPFRNYIAAFDGGARLRTPGSGHVARSKPAVSGTRLAIARQARPRVAALFEGAVIPVKHHPRRP